MFACRGIYRSGARHKVPFWNRTGPASVGTVMRTLPLVVLLMAACSPSEVLDSILPDDATAHERYAESLRAAGLDSTALGREWLAAGDSALRDPFTATLPAREVGIYTRHEARAVAYRLELEEGQRLEVSLRADGLPARLFLDLFEVTGDSARPFRHRATADTLAIIDSAATVLALEHEIRRDGQYVVRLQPELLRGGRYELVLRTAPILAFPVEGHDHRDIRSYFGAERDGGRRSHHGVDIFAPRGTAVLAATIGVVRSTRPNNLGGNVVWLRDEQRGQSIYYAHLDSVTAYRGQQVRIGDTLGFVGNSGNARTTPPHLHFGIYERGRGPIDPLPWVRLARAEPPPVRADTASLGFMATARSAGVTLRDAPARTGEETLEVPPDRALQIMAATADWYRVQLEDGSAGYLSSRDVRIQLSGEAATRD